MGYAGSVVVGPFPLLLVLLGVANADEPARPFSVVPYGWVQPGFAWRQDDAALLTDTDGFSAAARFGIEATAEPIQLRARVEVDLQPEPVLEDAFVNWSPHPVFSLNAGQMKVPFSISHLASDTRRQLPVDNAVTRVSGIDRDLGVSAEFRLPIAQKPRAAVSSAVMNGEGKNRLENVNDSFMFAQRLVVYPLGPRERPAEGRSAAPYLGLGGGWVYNFTGADDSATEFNTFAAELQFAAGVFSIQAEFADVEVVHASPDVVDYHSTGTYGQLGLFIPAPWVSQHVELVGRAGWAEPNDALASNIDEVATIDIDVGINLYIPETPPYMQDVKLQVAYRHSIQDEGGQVDDDRLDVVATVRF